MQCEVPSKHQAASSICRALMWCIRVIIYSPSCYLFTCIVFVVVVTKTNCVSLYSIQESVYTHIGPLYIGPRGVCSYLNPCAAPYVCTYRAAIYKPAWRIFVFITMCTPVRISAFNVILMHVQYNTCMRTRCYVRSTANCIYTSTATFPRSHLLPLTPLLL